MQQSPQMIPMVSSFPPRNITTDQIQKYLDENKKLIMAILENQNLGKLRECAQYQALLQKNLMYLAAIADAQPQPPGDMTPQAMVPHPPSSMQPPPSYFMQQHQQVLPGPLQFSSPNELLQHPQQQAIQGHMGIRPMGLNYNNGLQHPMHHPETALGAANAGLRSGGKQDGTDVSQSGANGQGGSAARHGGDVGKIEGK